MGRGSPRLGVVGGLTASLQKTHIDRSHKDRNYGNLDIDKLKTHLNMDLYDPVDGYPPFIQLKHRLSDVSHTDRKDLVVCVGCVITLPKDLKTTRYGQEKFFRCCEKFLNEKFGKENSIYATVHYDETTPHLHYGFVPVVKKARKYRSKAKAGQTYEEERICAKEVVTRAMLNSFHSELQAYLDANLGMPCTVYHDDGIKRDKTISELKTETIQLHQQAVEDTKQAQELKNALYDEYAKTKNLKQKYERLREICSDNFENLSQEAQNELFESHGIGHAVREVSYTRKLTRRW